MNGNSIPFSALLEGLRTIGREELLPRFASGTRVDYKADGSVITPADHAADAAVRRLLRDCGIDEPVLSEEQDEPEQQRVLDEAPAFWLLDPLDGTSNFATGLPFFAISLARIEGQRVTHGATLDPVRGELFSVTEDGPLLLDGSEPDTAATAPPEIRRCIALVDYKRVPRTLGRALLGAAPFASQRNLGACALEWAWLAAGRADLYLHGGQALWDSTAGTLMLERAGGAMADLSGAPVFRRDLARRPAIAARTPQLQAVWHAWITEHLDPPGSGASA